MTSVCTNFFYVQDFTGDLCQFVYEQLLHVDLREVVKEGCFDGINFHLCGSITGTFFVQVCMQRRLEAGYMIVHHKCKNSSLHVMEFY